MASSSARRAVLYVADARRMPEIPDENIGLIVTSPPYWRIKDYGSPDQIGYGQSLHEYLYDLARVWQECWRVLMPGRRLCINIGDQFARATVYGQYRVIPLHAEIIAQCEQVGFDYLGAIIWQKKTTMRPSGGAVVMRSFPFPPNGIVELDYEYILIFRKPGRSSPVSEAQRQASALSRDEWKLYFSGHWHFGGERQTLHEAVFPEELPRRLIRMFSFVGEKVLDPFAGSGTTLKVALELERQAVGYEVQKAFIPLIQQKISGSLLTAQALEICERTALAAPASPPPGYVPAVKDCRPHTDASPSPEAPLHRITHVMYAEELSAPILVVDNGWRVSLLGVEVAPAQWAAAEAYLRRYVVGKRVILRLETSPAESKPTPAYVYLRNRLFINRKMIEMGIARAAHQKHRYYERFLRAEAAHRQAIANPEVISEAERMGGIAGRG